MNSTPDQVIRQICAEHGNDRHRLLDVLINIQSRFRGVDDHAMDVVARALSVPRVSVEGMVTFYAFLSREPRGRVLIRLCNDLIDEFRGAREVAAGLEDELGIRFGETTPDGQFSLQYTSCIGLSDQAPAALVNDVMVPRLRPGAAREMVRALRDLPEGGNVRDALDGAYGGGNNSHDLVRSMVENNLRQPGPVIFGPSEPGAALAKALALSPVEVIREIKTSRLRGRAGGGFPTGMKWEYTRAASSGQCYLVCNADEGEPGTFKDRVILTERPHLVFEGMTVGGYAIGADQGIVYLRAEYAYLRDFLEHVLQERRDKGLLGEDILGKKGFRFDIRIQMGAGAYICGEETALIESCEGRRGEPRIRPPFPAQVGYLGQPTAVNNVETLCCAARILEMGSGWFSSIGTPRSTGTKLLSISGDCNRPGVYEIPLGTPLSEILRMSGANATAAAQLGGASGRMIGPREFDRAVCFDDLSTGGSLMVFDKRRDVLRVVSEFMKFFVHESCGHCTPCRVGTVLLKERVDRILDGRGEPPDLDYLEQLGETVAAASRCGLGQSAPRPVLSSLESFRSEYERRLQTPVDGQQPAFDLGAALEEARGLTGREEANP